VGSLLSYLCGSQKASVPSVPIGFFCVVVLSSDLVLVWLGCPRMCTQPQPRGYSLFVRPLDSNSCDVFVCPPFCLLPPPFCLCWWPCDFDTGVNLTVVCFWDFFDTVRFFWALSVSWSLVPFLHPVVVA